MPLKLCYAHIQNPVSSKMLIKQNSKLIRRPALLCCLLMLSLSSPASASFPATTGIDTLYLLKLFLALLFVLGIFLLLARVVRQMNGVNNTSLGPLSVVASLSVGSRERIVVVKVGEEQLVLGIGPSGITMLQKLDKPIIDDAESVKSSFRHQLHSIMGDRLK